MSEKEILGMVIESSVVYEFSFIVEEEKSHKVFKNSYVVAMDPQDPSYLTLSCIVELSSKSIGRKGRYIAKCRVITNLNREGEPEPPIRPVRYGSKILTASDELLQDFFKVSDPSLVLGEVSGFPRVKFFVPFETIRSTSVLVAGMTGSGKTSSVMTILKQLRKSEIASLVFDITGEYVDNFKKQANILIPGKNFTMSIDEEFLESFSNWAVLSELQIRLLYQSYSRFLTESRTPDFEELIHSLESEDRRTYRVLAGIERKLSMLKNAELLSGKDLETRRIPLENSSIVDLSELDSTYQSLVIDYLLRLVFHHMKRNPEYSSFIVLEMAHHFIPRGRILIPAVRDIVRAGRKYQTQLCFITQKPSLCNPSILSYCGLQLIHTLRNSKDLMALAEFSEFIEPSLLEEISRLAHGQVLVLGPKIQLPTIVRVRLES